MNKQKLTTKADQKKHKNKQTQNKIKQKKIKKSLIGSIYNHI